MMALPQNTFAGLGISSTGTFFVLLSERFAAMFFSLFMLELE